MRDHVHLDWNGTFLKLPETEVNLIFLVANIVKAYAARAGFDASMFRGEKGFEATAG